MAQQSVYAAVHPANLVYQNRRIQPCLFVTCLTVVAGTGLALLVAATTQAAGVTPDSIIYLGVADNIFLGRGLRMAYGANSPLVHYPPFYSIVLAGFRFAGVSLPDAARWLNVGLYLASLTLLSQLLHRLTQSRLLTLAGLASIALSEWFLSLHSMVWSEPLFITLVLASLLCLQQYQASSKTLLLLVSACTIGLALVTRYAGLPLLPAGTLALALAGRSRPRAIRDALLFATTAAIPLGLWEIQVWSAIGRLSTRTFGVHLSTDYHWLVLLGLLLSLAGLLRGRRISRPIPLVVSASFWMTLAYLVFIWITMSFFDQSTPINDRIISIAYITGLLALAWVFAQGARGAGWHLMALFSVTGLFLFVANLEVSAEWAKVAARDGIAYSARYWRESPLVQATRELPPEVTIYSNGFDMLYYWTGRNVLAVPASSSAVEEYAAMRRAGSVIVYFTGTGVRPLSRPSELSEHLSLVLMRTTPHGDIYEIR
jgi:hypothetical protein